MLIRDVLRPHLWKLFPKRVRLKKAYGLIRSRCRRGSGGSGAVRTSGIIVLLYDRFITATCISFETRSGYDFIQKREPSK